MEKSVRNHASRRRLTPKWHLFADDLRPHVSLYNMTLPHVAHTEHQAWNSVPVTNHRAAGEEQRLCPLLRPGQLGEHDTYHKCLDKHAHDALQRQEIRYLYFRAVVSEIHSLEGTW